MKIVGVDKLNYWQIVFALSYFVIVFVLLYLLALRITVS